jgi:hypothetical protein
MQSNWQYLGRNAFLAYLPKVVVVVADLSHHWDLFLVFQNRENAAIEG